MRFYRLHNQTLFLFLAILSLSFLTTSCNFRDPDEGYDRDWVPDHDASEKSGGEENSESSQIQEGESTGSLSEDSDPLPYKRPADIAADTSRMQATTGEWSEMNATVKTSYKVYRDKGKIAMIVEKTENSTRTYYYNQGSLFYYNEKGDDGSTELTVEFDDFGDVRGAQKTINGKRAYTKEEDFSKIVEHAVELRVANETE
ncbi:MAG: hypothetical protein AB7H80_11860 [Candidatus Kapaibacterium sp.]